MIFTALIPLLSSPFPIGSSQARLADLDVFIYKPRNYRSKRMIMVMHGTLRNGAEYRDHSVSLAERTGALIVVPQFERPRFANWQYNRGGVVNDRGEVQPASTWTYRYLPRVAAEVRQREGQMPFSIIGHSAGGQFLVRMSAFAKIGAAEIVAANPGSLLFPRTDWEFGYGFGGLTGPLSDTVAIRGYLAAPLTLYTGLDDDHVDEDLDNSPEANRQGLGRTQRAQACYAYAQALAIERGWKFNWRLIKVAGIGHDHEKMFDAPEAEVALFGR
jgi:pimeloyl-ACP methyl ester carboxylesterase